MLGDIAAFLGLFGQGGVFGKSRPSARDLQFMADMERNLQPQKTATTGAYLTGLAPYEATAYNTYQDATYTADTARQISRTQEMAGALGMSPWELMGNQGAVALPSPQLSGSSASAASSQVGQYMGNMTQASIAQSNNRTALTQTAIQALTQAAIADQQTAGGQVGLTQAQLNAANTVNAALQSKQIQAATDLTTAQEARTWSETERTSQQTTLDAIATIAEWAGKTTVSIGPYSTTTTNQYPELMKLFAALRQNDTGARNADIIQNYTQSLPKDQFVKLTDDLQKAIDAMLATGANIGGSALDSVSNFLDGLVKGASDMFSGKQ